MDQYDFGYYDYYGYGYYGYDYGNDWNMWIKISSKCYDYYGDYYGYYSDDYYGDYYMDQQDFGSYDYYGDDYYGYYGDYGYHDQDGVIGDTIFWLFISVLISWLLGS